MWPNTPLPTRHTLRTSTQPVIWTTLEVQLPTAQSMCNRWRLLEAQDNDRQPMSLERQSKSRSKSATSSCIRQKVRPMCSQVWPAKLVKTAKRME